MKKVEAIIRVEKFDEVMEALKEVGYPGLTRTPVEGHGKQKGIRQQFRGTTFEVEFLPKLKIEVVVMDQDVRPVVSAISRSARTGEIGDGKIFIIPVDNAVRIRTGDRGGNAV